MNVLLVHAAFPRTYWGFQHALAIAGKRSSLPPLGLITVAALLPRAWAFKLVDLNVEALADDDLRWADAVLVGGMLLQAPSMREVLARARALGRRTIAGGPAGGTPEELPGADVIVAGEVEGRAGELAEAIAGSGARFLPVPRGAWPDVGASPVPRFDLLHLDRYASMAIQSSRGCPFHCEFCDVIETFGRTPRVKRPSQLVGELDALYALGWRGPVFVVDDNFIGNARQARALLAEITVWQEARRHPLSFYTEASVNLACDPSLMRDMVAAGFDAVFVGLETPSPQALREAGKTQNLRLDLAEAVDTITRAGLEVMGGFIVGFDSDGPDIFAAMRRFLDGAPIPLAMAGILTALPGTALARRLAGEGRLRGRGSGEQFARPNFAPGMDEELLLREYAALLAGLYSAEAYLRRCTAYLDKAPVPSVGAPRRGGLAIALRAVWRLGIMGRRRGAFWRLLLRAARRSPRAIPWAIARALQGEHLARYTHEDVLPRLALAAADVRAGQGMTPPPKARLIPLGSRPTAVVEITENELTSTA